MRVLENIEPKKVFGFFEDISAIPRGSGNEEAIADFVENFGKERGFETYRDEWNNVIVRKPATKGKEASPITILQGHIDMVCVKEAGYDHDFLKDGLSLYIDGEFLKARSTTLGADNGIAVAYMLAILDSEDVEHPALECLFTTDEEVGMTGAIKLDKTVLKGKYFINIDSEEEGIITVGCAGGNRSTINLAITREEASSSSETYELHISGLKGGHSGMEIDKNRANSNVLMGRVLNELAQNTKFNLLSVEGGNKDNVICNNSRAFINIEPSDISKLEADLKIISAEIKNEMSEMDKDISITLTKVDKKSEQLGEEFTKKVIYILNVAPNGVMSMSSKLVGMVESSLNIGILETRDEEISFNYSIRANVASKKYDLIRRLRLIAEQMGAEFKVGSDYPEWEFKKGSKLLEIAENTYRDFSGKEAEVQAVHAGLEPGVFLNVMPDVEAISIGPDMFDVHSVDERLNIASAERMYYYVLELLKRL